MGSGRRTNLIVAKYRPILPMVETKFQKSLELNQFGSEESKDNKNYWTELEKQLSGVLTEYNDRNVEDVQRHLKTIEQALEKDIKGNLDLKFGGSVEKHTYVKGLSDNDMLVQLNNSELKNKSPGEVLNYFEQRLKERLPNSDISVGKLAVTVKFSSTETEIQLLPAIKTSTGLKLVNSNGDGWSKVVKPHKFSTELTKVNQDNGGKVVQVIKLLKGMNSKFPKSAQMSGYHIEASATEIFRSYDGPKTLSKMVKYYCEQARKKVLTPIKETTNQSEIVDSKLGQSYSFKRVRLSGELSIVSQKIKKADKQENLDKWTKIL